MLFPKTVYLRESCQARLNAESLTLPFRIVLYPLGRFGAGPDQTHVARQNVPQLGQLSETEPGKQSPKAVQVNGIPVHVHSPHREHLAIQPAAELSSKRPFSCEDHTNSTQQQDR